MKLLGLNKVIVLSPHPDDAEYSMGATISKYRHTMFYVITLSPGGNYDDTTKTNRIDESNHFWRDSPNVMLYPCRPGAISDSKEDELVNYVESLIKKEQQGWKDVGAPWLQMNALFVPPQLDSHFEHRIINTVGRAVCRLDRMSLVEYHTPSTLNTWTANFYVSVDEYVDSKKTRLKKCFSSQNDKHYFSHKALDAFHSDYFCEKRGVGAVEKYRVDFFFDVG